jgi:hypothetical protein
MKGEGIERLSTGPRTLHHFWPRLWFTAKPLGGEARKEKSSGALPVKVSPVDDLDSRILVQGGEWILNHTERLTTEEAAVSAHSATCVMLMKGSDLHESACLSSENVDMIQGVLKSVDVDSLECELSIATEDHEQSTGDEEGQSECESDVESGKHSNVIETTLTDEDIWWCLPYWAAASYNLHFEKIPVERGFYFLVEAGQAFCIVTINWGDTDVFLLPKVDGRKVSQSRCARLRISKTLCSVLFIVDTSTMSIDNASVLYSL